MQKKWIWSLCGLVLLAPLLLLEAAPGKFTKCVRYVQQTIHRIDVALNLTNSINAESPLLRSHRGGYTPACAELWIAHGGGIGRYVYTNCLEAVQDSLNRGFKYVELDLLTTTDGYLVGGHDWTRVRELAGIENTIEKPISRSELMAYRAKWKQTLLFAEDICQLMKEHPHMILVTDKVQDFDLLARSIPYTERTVVEAFDCYSCLEALRAGFRNVALSAWSIEGMYQARQYKLPGIVLSATVLNSNPAAAELAKQMHQEGCCIMVHGSAICDSSDFIHKYLGKSISRIYTDTWSPAEAPAAP